MNKILKNFSKIFILISVAVPFFFSTNVKAISSEEIFTRILVNNIDHCYGYSLTPSIAAQDYQNFDSLMNYGYKQNSPTMTFNMIRIPDYDNDLNKIKQTDEGTGGRVTSCYALFAGDPTGLGTLKGNMKGLFNIYNITIPKSDSNHSDMDKVSEFMTNILHYKANTVKSSDTQYCYTIYKNSNSTAYGDEKIGSYCRNEDNYPINNGESIAFSVEKPEEYSISGVTGASIFTINIYEESTKVCSNGRGKLQCWYSTSFNREKPQEGEYETYQTNNGNNNKRSDKPSLFYVKVTTKNNSGSSSINTTYEKPKYGDMDKAEDALRKTLTGSSQEYEFSDPDKYDFYLQYLTSRYARTSSIASDTCYSNKPQSIASRRNNYYYIFVKDKGWCKADLDENKVENMHDAMTVFSSNERYVLDKVIYSAEDLVKLMGELDYSDPSAFADVDSINESDGKDPTPEEDYCYNAGIDSMSWILCPAIHNTTTTVDVMEQTIRDWLSIDSNQLMGDETYEAWTHFRNIANIILTMILVVIIFSQITGYGIDNYGVKKMLPRLIAIAVLLNLSFFLCKLAIDVSNIMGVGLDNMFKALGIQINGGSDVFNDSVAQMVEGILGLAAGAGMSSGVIFTVLTTTVGGSVGPMIIFSLVLVLLAALVAILLFFLMLGARMVIVILFTTISPIAFVLYILPNTKSLFKKWWDIFKAALVVFPICGALYGLSFVIRAIISGGGSENLHFFNALLGVIAPLLPFFALPSLLKGAMSGLGALSGTLTNLGNGIRKGIKSGNDTIRGSERFKEEQNENLRNQQKRRAEGIVNRLKDKQKKAKEEGKPGLSDREQRKLAHYSEVSDKLKREDAAARTILAESDFIDKTEPELQKAWEDAYDSADKEKLDALTNVMYKRNPSEASKFIAKKIKASDVKNDANAQQSIRTLRENMLNNSTFASQMKAKDEAIFKMIGNAGQSEKGYENAEYFAAPGIHPSDKIESWFTQSTDAFRSAAETEAISGDMADKMLESQDSRVISGILSDNKKVEILQARSMVDRLNKGKSDEEKIKLTDDNIKEYAEQYQNRQKEIAEQKEAIEQKRQETLDKIADHFAAQDAKELQVDHNKPEERPPSRSGPMASGFRG